MLEVLSPKDPEILEVQVGYVKQKHIYKYEDNNASKINTGGKNLTTNEFALKTIFINPDHVITIIEDDRIQNLNERQPLWRTNQSHRTYIAVVLVEPIKTYHCPRQP